MGNKNTRTQKFLYSDPDPISSTRPTMSKSFALSNQTAGQVADQAAKSQNNEDGTPLHLRFRSWQNGNLVTPKGDRPSTGIKSNLSGATPAFVPSSKTTHPQADNSFHGASPPLFTSQGLIIPSRHIPIHNRDNTEPFPFYTSPPTNAIINTSRFTTRAIAPINAPTGPSRVFLTRVDASKKDIVISSSGIQRNVMRVTQRFFAREMELSSAYDEFDPATYDLLTALGKMTVGERDVFWATNWLEIRVNFRDLDRDPELKMIERAKDDGASSEDSTTAGVKSGDGAMCEGGTIPHAKPGGTKVENNKSGDANTQVNNSENNKTDGGKSQGAKFSEAMKEKTLDKEAMHSLMNMLSIEEDKPGATKHKRSSSTEIKNTQELIDSITATNNPPLIQHIQSLGPSAYYNVAHIFITLLLPSAIDPITNIDAVPHPTSYHTHFLHTLTTTLNLFNSSLTDLEITMVTPSSTSQPVSLTQLPYALPFYDLTFTDWELKWKQDFMSKSETLTDWCLSWLDRQRSKAIWAQRNQRRRRAEEKRKLDDMVFVTYSQAGEPFDIPRGGGVSHEMSFTC